MLCVTSVIFLEEYLSTFYSWVILKRLFLSDEKICLLYGILSANVLYFYIRLIVIKYNHKKFERRFFMNKFTVKSIKDKILCSCSGHDNNPWKEILVDEEREQ